MATISYNGQKITFDINEYQIIPDYVVLRNDTAGGKVYSKKFHGRRSILISRRGIPKEEAYLLHKLFGETLNGGAEFDLDVDECVGEFWDFAKTTTSLHGLEATVVRNSTATYYDHKLKQVVSVAINTPRWAEGVYGEYALLVEENHNNILTYSETIEDASWSDSNLDRTDNFSEELAPDGTNTATLIEENASSGGKLWNVTGTAIVNDNAAFSVWLKLAFAPNVGGGRNVTLNIVSSTNGNQRETQAVTLTTEWQRFFVAKDNDDVWDDDWLINIDDIKADVKFFMWGAQLTTNYSYPLSYIPTSGTIAETQPEYYEYSLVEGEHFNRNEGAVTFWLYPLHNATVNQLTNKFRVFELHNATRQFMVLEHDNDDDVMRYRFARAVDTSEGANIDVTDTDTTLTPGEWHHVYMDWNFTGGLFHINMYVDNTSVGSAATRAAPPIGDMFLRFGFRDLLPAEFLATFSCSLSEFVIWKRTLTATERSAIYGRSWGLGQRETRWKVKYKSHEITQGETNDRVDFTAEFYESIQ